MIGECCRNVHPNGIFILQQRDESGRASHDADGDDVVVRCSLVRDVADHGLRDSLTDE